MEFDRYRLIGIGMETVPNRYRFLDIDQYRYQLIGMLPILSDPLHILIGNIAINRYRYGSISKTRYQFGKSPYRYQLFGIGRALDPTIESLVKFSPIFM